MRGKEDAFVKSSPFPRTPFSLVNLRVGGDNLSSFSFTHCVTGSGCFNGNLSSLQFYCRSADSRYLFCFCPVHLSYLLVAQQIKLCPMHGIFTPLALSSYKINSIPAPHFPRKLMGEGDNLSSFSFTHCVTGSGCFNGNLSSLQFYCRSADLGYLNAIYPHFRLLVMRRVWALERLFIFFHVYS